MFGDTFVKVVLNFEFFCFFSLFNYIWISKKYYRLLINTPIIF
jgi:hypothetical protein